MIVNRLELSDVLGCALATVDKHVKDGCPFVERPNRDAGAKEWRFDTKEVIKFLIEKGHENTPQAAEKALVRREQAAKTGLKELELAEKQGQMVTSDDAAELLEEQLGIVKSRITAIPGRLAQALAVETDPATVLRLLKVEVSEALEAISGA